MKFKNILAQLAHEPHLTPLRIFWAVIFVAGLIISFLALKLTFKFEGPSFQFFSLSLGSLLIVVVCAVMLLGARFLPFGQNIFMKLGLLLARAYLYLTPILLTLKLAIDTQNILVVLVINIFAILGLVHAFPKTSPLTSARTT